MFLVVGHQVCTHLRRDFVPLLFADPLQVIKILRLKFGNLNLQLPPQIFYGIKVWRLARPLQNHNVLLLEGPLLCCLGHVFCVIVMLEYPSTTHFQCPGPNGTWPRPYIYTHLKHASITLFLKVNITHVVMRLGPTLPAYMHTVLIKWYVLFSKSQLLDCYITEKCKHLQVVLSKVVVLPVSADKWQLSNACLQM